MNYFRIKAENDKIFADLNSSEMQSEVFFQVEAPQTNRKEKFSVKENLLCSDTITAILAKPEKKTLALNFANAMFAGGGYIFGGNAQEEALCRASMLYYTIRTAKNYYQANRKHLLPDYTDYMIYSRNVPIIRKNSGERLAIPVYCDFLTSPAVNRRFAKFFFSGKQLDKIMQNRIMQIIQLCAVNQPERIILGAFGCGVFGNSREKIYPMFETAINLFIPDGIEIVFADPESKEI